MSPSTRSSGLVDVMQCDVDTGSNSPELISHRHPAYTIRIIRRALSISLVFEKNNSGMTNSRKRRMPTSSTEDAELSEDTRVPRKKRLQIVFATQSTATTMPSQSPPPAVMESDNSELLKLREELAMMKSALRGHEKLIERAKQAINCNICLETSRLPQILVPCGHMACYGCLKSWFLNPPNTSDDEADGTASDVDHHEHGHANANNNSNGNNTRNAAAPNPSRDVTRMKKHCPLCRIIITSRPVPVYVLRDMGDILDPRPPAEKAKDTDINLASDVWKDIFPPVKDVVQDANDAPIRNDVLRPNNHSITSTRTGPLNTFYDFDDHVRRCGVCMHEIWNQMCSNRECGAVYDDDDDDEEDSDGDFDDQHQWIDPFPGTWNGFTAYSYDEDEDDDDNSYESSFIDDDKEDYDDENASSIINVDEDDEENSVSDVWPYNIHGSYSSPRGISPTHEASTDPNSFRLNHRNRNRNRRRSSSIILEDDEDGSDNGDDIYSIGSSEDFVSSAVLRERSDFTGEVEVTSSVDYRNESSDYSGRPSRRRRRRGLLDENDVIHEDDSEGETVSSDDDIGRISGSRARLWGTVVSESDDEEEDENVDDNEEEDEEESNSEEDDSDEMLSTRNYTRRRGRIVISEQDDDGKEEEEEEDSDPVRPHNVRRGLVRIRPSRHTPRSRR